MCSPKGRSPLEAPDFSPSLFHIRIKHNVACSCRQVPSVGKLNSLMISALTKNLYTTSSEAGVHGRQPLLSLGPMQKRNLPHLCPLVSSIQKPYRCPSDPSAANKTFSVFYSVCISSIHLGAFTDTKTNQKNSNGWSPPHSPLLWFL